MTLLTADEFKEHVTTSLEDEAIERLLDDAEDTINAFAGPVGAVVEYVLGGTDRISTSRPIATISAIDERYGSHSPVTIADRHEPGEPLARAGAGFVHAGRRHGHPEDRPARTRPARHRHEPGPRLGNRGSVDADLFLDRFQEHPRAAWRHPFPAPGS